MVLDYYNLAAQPFGVTPDPRSLYLGTTHREALASLVYGLGSGRGFMALFARPGMGKTTLLWHLLQQLPDPAWCVFLFQTQGSPHELLGNVLSDLGIEHDSSSLTGMYRKLNEALVSQSDAGHSLIIVIDEAQNLTRPSLEALRLISNFETPRQKLVQIILSGHPQLAEKLTAPDLMQLRQRMSILARLDPFGAEETCLYIAHRLRAAGYDSPRPLFTDKALELIANYCEGIPRNINNVCFLALSLGFAKRQETIGEEVIQEVLDDLDFHRLLMACGDNREIRESISTVPSPVPSSVSAETPPQRPLLRRSTPRFVIAASLAVLVSGLGFGLSKHSAGLSSTEIVSRSHAPSSTLVTHTPVTGVPSSVEVAARSAAVSQPAGGVRVPKLKLRVEGDLRGTQIVTVLPGQTLYRICVNSLGRYDDEVLSMVLALNPELQNPTQIEAGQAIVLPVNLSGFARRQHSSRKQDPGRPETQ